MVQVDTSTKILDTAEELFANQGIGQTSIRSIVAAAGVNVAAIHYHFGSKEELLKAVFGRRIGAVNEIRLSRLEELRKKYGESPVAVEELIEAFVAPALKVARDEDSGAKNFARCVARAHAETEPEIQEALLAHIRDILKIFLEELGRSLPELDPQERAMRLSSTAGVMVHMILLPLKPLLAQQLLPTGTSTEEITQMVVAFCAGGMKAPKVLSGISSGGTERK